MTAVQSTLDSLLVPLLWPSRLLPHHASHCRSTGLPLQIAVIEFARNVLHMENANSTEVDPATEHPVRGGGQMLAVVMQPRFGLHCISLLLVGLLPALR